MIKDKIQKLLGQDIPNGKQIVMIFAEELDKVNNEIIELKKRLPINPSRKLKKK